MKRQNKPSYDFNCLSVDLCLSLLEDEMKAATTEEVKSSINEEVR